MIQTPATPSPTAWPHRPVKLPFRTTISRLLPVGLTTLILICGLSVGNFAEGEAFSRGRTDGIQNSEARAKLQKSAPLSEISDQALEKRVRNQVEDLGSLSIGQPNNGRLLNGIRPKEGQLFEVVAPEFAWGTAETLRFMTDAVEQVHRKHKGTKPLHVGHISRDSGGYLKPHLSHQSGRDVDLGYYYLKSRAWYRRATWKNLDVPRTWTFVRAVITRSDVEMILIDASLQKLLRAHAEKRGENREWLHRVFRGSAARPAIIRHVRGHATHMHVRFYSPDAQRNAQRAYPFLLEQELVEPVVSYIQHRVKKGESLGRLARRYGTTVKAIQHANGLRGTVIQARRTYKIPRPGGPAPILGKIDFHRRQLP